MKISEQFHSPSIVLLTNLFFSLFLFFSPLYSGINGPGDIEYWQYVSFEQTLSEKSAFFYQTELRFADNVSKPYFTYIQGIYLYSPTPNVSFGPGYRQILFRSDERGWRPAYSPLVDIIFNGDLGCWKWIDRSRVQYVMTSERNFWVYRNRLRFIIPFSCWSFSFDDEVFFVQWRGFAQNRFSVGPIFQISSNVSARLFYLLRHIELPDWRVNHVFGCYLFFKF